MPEHTETLQNNHHIEFQILAIMYVLGFSNNNIKLDKESFNGNFDDMQYVYDVYLKKYGMQIMHFMLKELLHTIVPVFIL